MNNFDRAYTFIYYKDMKKASAFYRDLLGLEEEVESSWTTLYKVTSDYSIGVVQDGEGHLRATEDKPVIICLGLNDNANILDLYQKMEDGGVKMQTSKVELRDIEGRIFFCEDPEGYTVEIVQRPKSS